MRMRTCCWLAAAVLLLAVAAPSAQGETIRQGVDLWTTIGDGLTFASFEEDPIPAGFFCDQSKAFTGRIAFRGAPIPSEPAEALGGPIDTIVRRLDDAEFDAQGRAKTRIQLLALHLESIEPIETECGRYDVAVALEGQQPTTEMEIRRDSALGGTYSAPLSLRTKILFTQVADRGNVRHISWPVKLDAAPNSVWSYDRNRRYTGAVWVDTDGDRQPDNLLPPASNFNAGMQAVAPAQYQIDDHHAIDDEWVAQPASCGGYPVGTNCPAGTCPSQQCHCTPCNQNPQPGQPAGTCSHLHCLNICVRCGPVYDTHPLNPSISSGG